MSAFSSSRKFPTGRSCRSTSRANTHPATGTAGGSTRRPRHPACKSNCATTATAAGTVSHRQSGLPGESPVLGRLLLPAQLRPLEDAGGRFPLRPAGRRGPGELLPLHDRHLHAQPANQPAIPERRRLDNGRTGRSALRHRPQRALSGGGTLPEAVLPAQPDGLPLGRQVANGGFRSTWPPSRR